MIFRVPCGWYQRQADLAPTSGESEASFAENPEGDADGP